MSSRCVLFPWTPSCPCEPLRSALSWRCTSWWRATCGPSPHAVVRPHRSTQLPLRTLSLNPRCGAGLCIVAPWVWWRAPMPQHKCAIGRLHTWPPPCLSSGGGTATPCGAAPRTSWRARRTCSRTLTHFRCASTRPSLKHTAAPVRWPRPRLPLPCRASCSTLSSCCSQLRLVPPSDVADGSTPRGQCSTRSRLQAAASASLNRRCGPHCSSGSAMAGTRSSCTASRPGRRLATTLLWRRRTYGSGSARCIEILQKPSGCFGA
mmetsp:Transcript_138896/g.360984  ORF Transcript_138896/g.360984 Transcript_138896/m.360984 type:complete len:263 (+) Transcript_138896:682-1470(+)